MGWHKRYAVASAAARGAFTSRGAEPIGLNFMLWDPNNKTNNNTSSLYECVLRQNCGAILAHRVRVCLLTYLSLVSLFVCVLFVSRSVWCVCVYAFVFVYECFGVRVRVG